MIAKAVIGLGFGDEGKGMFTDYLCFHTSNPLVIRYNGGHQAGHTVCPGRYSNSHVFANFGSGTLRDIPTYWSKFCTVDPIALMREYDILKKDYDPVIYIDERCPITTPYEVKQNLYVQNVEHGSCGVGFGATIKREEEFYHLNFIDLFYPEVLYEKLSLLEKYYGRFETDVNMLYDACERIIGINNIKPCFGIPKNKEYNYIFEGAQGLLLDQHHGFFPHVTRSNTGTKNILELHKYINEIYLITRAYQTRHGNGFMTNFIFSHNIKNNPDETNKRNYQGDFRISLLDVSLLEYAMKKDEHIRERNCKLVITCLDHVENDYRFTYKGEIVQCINEKDFVEKISKCLRIKHVFLSSDPYPTIEEVLY